MAELKAAFDEFDVDSEGAIDVYELRGVIISLGFEVMEQES